jgi:hypothetical protein
MLRIPTSLYYVLMTEKEQDLYYIHFKLVTFVNKSKKTCHEH